MEELLVYRGSQASYTLLDDNARHPVCSEPQSSTQPPSLRRHFDEMVCSIAGNRWFLRQAVDDEGIVLDTIMQNDRDTAAALRRLTRLLRTQPVVPELITTDGLRSYTAALSEMGLLSIHRPGRLRDNNRAENSHLSIRRLERKQRGSSPQISSALSRHSCRRLQHLQHQPHLSKHWHMCHMRVRALATWTAATRAA